MPYVGKEARGPGMYYLCRNLHNVLSKILEGPLRSEATNGDNVFEEDTFHCQTKVLSAVVCGIFLHRMLTGFWITDK